ncbi:MAG: YceI family protein, partial [Bacteroidota bacterium]|nr:YceI family protein [Bacteroidota bacterium]
MKKIYLLSMAALSAAVISSCGNPSTENKPEEDNAEVSTPGNLALVSESVEVNWTAYKFTEKAGVSGHFDSVWIYPGKETGSVSELLEGARFEILVASTNTGNADRDMKIANLFFGSLTDSEKITGKVTGLEGGNENGKANVLLSLNGMEHPVELTYVVTDNQIQMSGEINVEEWNAMEGIQKLNKECEQLHTG